MVIGTSQFALPDVRSHLIDCGYSPLQLVTDIPMAQGRSVPLAAFAHSPHDSRSACIAVIDSYPDALAAVVSCRDLGAPLVLTYFPDQWQVWKQGPVKPQFLRRMPAAELPSFFKDRKKVLGPQSIYRAKTWARFDTSYQLDFVDVGLMPLVEEEAGRKLAELIERVVLATKSRLNWKEVSEEQAYWLLKSNFWLLAAKILKDKNLSTFATLDLENLQDVFARVAKHYGATTTVRVGAKLQADALRESSQKISMFSHLGLVSTDALSYLYENALINKQIRDALGTHSTPTYLVDYIVGKLRPWIEEIPLNQRVAFEPACGHAAFLLSAMQLLSDLLPEGMFPPGKRHQYLRARLHGYDVDSFALEIARLRLTLADVPNPNGWNLHVADMFKSDLLPRRSRKANIILANPPFANFSSSDRRRTDSSSTRRLHINKATEVLRQVVFNMQPGAVFGIVLPETLLRSRDAALTRQFITENFEIKEICSLPDKIFVFSDAESAVILGRRLTRRVPDRRSVLFRRVRESGIENFKRSYAATYDSNVHSSFFSVANHWDFFVPDLHEIWEWCRAYRKFGNIAEIGRGVEFRSETHSLQPERLIAKEIERGKGMLDGFVKLRDDLQTHELPDVLRLNLNPAVIRRPGLGTTSKKKQIILNCAPVSRGPWRLKAFLDRLGHAVTSNFLVIRPSDVSWSLEALWGLCNSPFANAYCYAFSTKRHILTGLIRDMPIPEIESADLVPLEKAVTTYLKYIQDRPGLITSLHARNELKALHWRIDAEVLRLYGLPPHLERQLLDLFSGVERRGVPFDQIEYFPKSFTEVSTLRDLMTITFDWDHTNERREELIDKKVKSNILSEEMIELDHLQELTDARIRLLAPLPIKQLEAVREDLKRRGMWEGD